MSNHITENQTQKPSAREVADFILNPNARSALTVQEFADTMFQGATYEALADELSKQINNTCKGDVISTCKTLAAQATILDILFQTLCCRAIQKQDGNNPSFFDEGYLKLALKCQKQSAATNAMLHYLLPKDANNENELSKILEEMAT